MLAQPRPEMVVALGGLFGAGRAGLGGAHPEHGDDQQHPGPGRHPTDRGGLAGGEGREQVLQGGQAQGGDDQEDGQHGGPRARVRSQLAREEHDRGEAESQSGAQRDRQPGSGDPAVQRQRSQRGQRDDPDGRVWGAAPPLPPRGLRYAADRRPGVRQRPDEVPTGLDGQRGQQQLAQARGQDEHAGHPAGLAQPRPPVRLRLEDHAADHPDGQRDQPVGGGGHRPDPEHAGGDQAADCPRTGAPQQAGGQRDAHQHEEDSELIAAPVAGEVHQRRGDGHQAGRPPGRHRPGDLASRPPRGEDRPDAGQERRAAQRPLAVPEDRDGVVDRQRVEDVVVGEGVGEGDDPWVGEHRVRLIGEGLVVAQRHPEEPQPQEQADQTDRPDDQQLEAPTQRRAGRVGRGNRDRFGRAVMAGDYRVQGDLNAS